MEECKLKLGQQLKTQKKRKGLTRVLIVENMQNCFFSKGSLAFMSQSTKEEAEFVEKINKIINFMEQDELYELAGKSGKEVKKKLNPLQTADFKTGARKKYYYDMIIFTQIANPPDHFSFASHHFLNDPNLFKHFSSTEAGAKFITSKKKLRMKQKKLYLMPDYALTDGEDSYMDNGKLLKGIDFHPKLDVAALYRPNDELHPNVFINPPRYYNRGYILTKGNNVSNNHSAFYNSDNKATGLSKFLKCNKVNSVTVCGVGRESAVYHTLMDSFKSQSIEERIVIHDATRPINIDLTKFKKKPEMIEEMRNDDIEDNRFLKRYINKGITVINSNNLFNFVDRLEGKFNRNDVGRIGALESMFEGSQSSVIGNNNLNSFTLKKKKRKKKRTKKA